jgi:hypothetical protein
MDYGDNAFREKANVIMEKEIPQIANDTIRRKTIENIEKFRSGLVRDFFV